MSLLVTPTYYTPEPDFHDVTGGWISGDGQSPTGGAEATGQGEFTGDLYGPYSGVKLVFCDHPVFTSCEELFDSVPGTPFRASGVRDYIRRFRVTCKINFIGAAGVCQCPGLPTPYSGYVPLRVVETDLAALAVEISADRENPGDWQAWVVTVRYSTEMPQGGRPDTVVQLGSFASGAQNEPWKEAPYIRIETEDYQVTPEVDRDGKAYTNIVNQPFTPPPSFPDGLVGLIIRRNEQHLTLDSVITQVEAYNYALNDGVFLGRQPGCWMCKVESVEEHYRGDIRYWTLVYRLRLKPTEFLNNGELVSTWQPRILNAGLYRFRKVFGVSIKDAAIVPIMRGAVPISHPVPLDAQGQPLVPDVLGNIVPVYLKFKHYRELDFTILTLPASKL